MNFIARLKGGLGEDSIEFFVYANSSWPSRVVNRLDGGDGNDDLVAWLQTPEDGGQVQATNRLDGGAGEDVLDATVINRGRSLLNGGGDDDILRVEGGQNNLLSGEGGSDRLFAGDGTDQHAAGQPLGHVELRHDVIDAAATASGASGLSRASLAARGEAGGEREPGRGWVISSPLLSAAPRSPSCPRALSVFWAARRARIHKRGRRTRQDGAGPCSSELMSPRIASTCICARRGEAFAVSRDGAGISSPRWWTGSGRSRRPAPAALEATGGFEITAAAGIAGARGCRSPG